MRCGNCGKPDDSHCFTFLGICIPKDKAEND